MRESYIVRAPESRDMAASRSLAGLPHAPIRFSGGGSNDHAINEMVEGYKLSTEGSWDSRVKHHWEESTKGKWENKVEGNTFRTVCGIDEVLIMAGEAREVIGLKAVVTVGCAFDLTASPIVLAKTNINLGRGLEVHFGDTFPTHKGQTKALHAGSFHRVGPDGLITRGTFDQAVASLRQTVLDLRTSIGEAQRQYAQFDLTCGQLQQRAGALQETARQVRQEVATLDHSVTQASVSVQDLTTQLGDLNVQATTLTVEAIGGFTLQVQNASARFTAIEARIGDLEVSDA